MNERRTWQDVEREAINDPLISMAVMMVRAGELSREDALCAATLGLYEVNRQLVEENLKLRARAKGADCGLVACGLTSHGGPHD